MTVWEAGYHRASRGTASRGTGTGEQSPQFPCLLFLSLNFKDKICITYFFKKIRDTKGTFHAKIGTIKNKNSKDL